MDETSRNTRLLTIVATVAVATMIAQHVAGKATRDALFLTYFPVEQLPLIMIVSAALSVAGVVLMSRLLGRFGPARLIPILFAISAGLLILQWQFIDAYPQVASALLYLQVSAINSLLISGFWSVINERFDPHSGKKVIARLAAAATFGGLAGGLAAKFVSAAADTNAILLMLALMHVLCGAAVVFIGRGSAEQADAKKLEGGLLAPLKASSLIRRMALLALLVATTAAMLDYILKAEADAALSDEDLISFFSYFYVAVGFGSFLLQSAVGNRALRWLGLGGTMAAWPLVVMATGTLTLAARSLVTATLMRASANLLSNSFYRAGFEVLYTPIPPEQKRTGKVMIDVGADRSGDIVGGLIVMAVLLLPAYSESVLLFVVLAMAFLCLVLILLLQRNYSDQLADNLRSGQLDIDDVNAVDATTAKTLAVTRQAIDRDALLKEIARSREQAQPEPAAAVAPAGLDPVTEAVAMLRSDDEAAIRRALVSREMSPELVPHAVALLKDERVLQDALLALRPAATRCAGQLVDALLNPMQNARIRRRLPVVLAYSDSPMAVQGLVSVLGERDWAIRFRAARALERIRRREPKAPMDADVLAAAMSTEVDSLSADFARGDLGRDGAARRLELVFLLMGAMGDPDTVDLSWRALNSDDRLLKGTALEYLENRLPPEVWARLQPLINKIVQGEVSRAESDQGAGEALRSAAGKLRKFRPRAAAESVAADLDAAELDASDLEDDPKTSQ